jgi:hypothetical protein
MPNSQILAQEQEDLLNDLMIVDYWNRKQNERLPVTYNQLLLGGYINMPSARMGTDGEMGIGYSYVPPYINYNLRLQFHSRLEISGNYRIFKGVDDPILSSMGFGDLSDKGANVKIALFLPEDSGYRLPGISLGYEDFMGTQNFKAQYVVLSQVLLNYDMEISLGFGKHRIKGFFGGINWMPFWRSSCSYLQGLSFTAEYDATPYGDEKIELHPKGRIRKSPVNFGFKYRLWNQLDLSLNYVRGHALSFSVSGYYNFGNTEGLLPKIDNALLYQAPVNNEPLGIMRPEGVLVQDLVYPFEEQGFDILRIWLEYDQEINKILRIRIVNNNYRSENEVRERLNHLIIKLIPEDIDDVIVTIESEGFPIQEYLFRMKFVRLFQQEEICLYEMNLMNILREVTYPNRCSSSLLFAQNRDRWNLELYPKTLTFFGSSLGKFKYALGLHLGLNGFLYDDLYYSLLFGYIFVSDLHNLKGIDRLNPSQIINVRTDIIKYYQQPGITIDEAYLQKNWNIGKGWYSRVAGGLFEEEYGGIAGEVLYFPVNKCWAIGGEAAFLGKRTYKGLGFTNKVRKLKGFVPTWRKFYGKQYFLDFYYNWYDCELDFKIKVGKFLANDYGARFELTRYFSSGLRVTVWYTHTNAHDQINGKNYHDKGVAFSLPLDIFYTHSERSRFGYGMSAWLRDVGVIACTGDGLYNLINEQREY